MDTYHVFFGALALLSAVFLRFIHGIVYISGSCLLLNIFPLCKVPICLLILTDEYSTQFGAIMNKADMNTKEVFSWAYFAFLLGTFMEQWLSHGAGSYELIEKTAFFIVVSPIKHERSVYSIVAIM